MMTTRHSRRALWAAPVLAAVLASSLLFVSVAMAAPAASTHLPAGGRNLVPAGRIATPSPLRPASTSYPGLIGGLAVSAVLSGAVIWAFGRGRMAGRAVVTELGPTRAPVEDESSRQDRRAA